MANISIKFHGTQRSESDDHELEAFVNTYNEIFITISGYSEEFICLDRSTAIKLVKHLRHEISKISEEVDNE